MRTKFLTIVSLCLLATGGGIASAESSNEAPDELTPAAMKILCENFPLNSRCTGEASAEGAVEETSSEAADTEMESSSDTEMESSSDTEMEGSSDTEMEGSSDTEMEGSSDTEMESSSDTEMEGSSDSSAAEGTIVEVASANDSFKTLVAAIQAADLAETLSGEGPFTVFAPTEEAFAALPPGAVEELLKPENKDKLVKVLTYHVVPTKAVSSDLTSGDVTTVAGDPVKVTVEDGAVTVNNASVVQADVMGSNGVIHVIDKVLLPPNL